MVSCFEQIASIPDRLANYGFPVLLAEEMSTTEKNHTLERLHLLSGFATVALVTSVAIGVFGMACVSGGGLLGVVGMPLIFTAVPAAYLSYNASALLSNISQIVAQPKSYTTLFSLGTVFSQERLRAQLSQSTIALNWLTDFIVDELVKKGTAQ